MGPDVWNLRSAPEHLLQSVTLTVTVIFPLISQTSYILKTLFTWTNSASANQRQREELISILVTRSRNSDSNSFITNSAFFTLLHIQYDIIFQKNKCQYSLKRGSRVVPQWWEHSLPPMWPGFESRRWRHMWIEFIVGSLLAPRGFSPGTPVSPLLKNQHFQIPIWSRMVDKVLTTLWLCYH